MASRHVLFLAFLLVRNVSFGLGFKIPGENRAEMPPRIRPDILQKANERASVGDGGNPVAPRSRYQQHRKRKGASYNAKGTDPKYSDPKYWNEVQSRYQQKRDAVHSNQRNKLVGIVWKTIAITIAICIPELMCILLVALLICGPWAIAGFALYKSVELFVEGNTPTCTPPFEKDENGDEMHNITYMYEAPCDEWR